MSGGPPGIDPATGMPISGSGGGAPPGLGEPGLGEPGMGGGLPGMGGGLPGMGGGLPGMGGGLPGKGGGLPGMGGGAPSTAMKGAFDPEEVAVAGLGSPLVNMTAKQILDIVTMSFDHPIQYVVLDQGIMFFQQNPKYAGTVTQTFQLNLNTRTLGQLGMQTPQLGGGGQNGGGQNGGGQNGGQGSGSGGGGYPGGPGGGGYPGGPGGGGPGMGGGGPSEPGMGGIEKNINRFRPFNSMGGYQRFNSFTSGYGPSRARERR